MAALVITILSEASEESVTSVFSRVILFSTIPTKILIVPDMPTGLPTVPELPTVSPFLDLNDSKFESADESSERHVSLTLHDDMVSRWRDRVRFRLSSPLGLSSLDTTISFTEIATSSPACISTLVIITSPAIRSRIQTTVRKSTLGLRPKMTPARSATLRRARRAVLSLETSSSDTSSGFSSDLAPASSSSAGPSRKRSRSSATSIPSTVHTTGVLSPTRADLLPPRKRYRGTSAMHSDESSDEGSLVMQTGSDMDSDIRVDVEAVTTTASTGIVDGLGIEPVLAGVEAGFEPGLAVVETKSELEEAEADEEADAEIQPEVTIEIGFDVAIGIDIPDDLLMPDAIERYRVETDIAEGYLQEIPLQRIDDIESRQTEQKGRNLIADSERSGYVEEELGQIRELRAHESQRLWRMETFMMRTQDYCP
ncbi:hypothetical protein Tco_1072362 [Tanacetum coccineum]